MYLRSGTKTGAITAQNDDHGTLVGTTTACANSTGLDNTDSCITITGLAAGSYTIEATTYATTTTGNFTLTVSGLGSTGGGGTPPPTDTCTDTISADGTTSGTWAAGCQSAETGRGYARYYGFTTTESKDITITLDSTVDTYMYLRSGTKTGAITAQNDDHATLLNTTTACANSTGLDTTDSCITVSGLAAGSYTIEATTYATATTGSFTLTVSGLSGTAAAHPRRPTPAPTPLAPMARPAEPGQRAASRQRQAEATPATTPSPRRNRKTLPLSWIPPWTPICTYVPATRPAR